MSNQEDNYNDDNQGDGKSVNIDERKLFIGGFAPQTKEEDFLEYFSKFGEVESVRLKIDPRSKKSKGYGFVIFTTPDPIQEIIAIDDHTINDRKITVGKAKLKEGKLFVGGIPADLSKDDLRNHFSQYGNIIDINIPFNKAKNERRPFCFITFESEKVVKDLAKNPKHLINGLEVDIEKANSDRDNHDNGRHFNQNNGYDRYNGPSRRPNIPVWDFGGYPSNNDNFNQGYQQRNIPSSYGSSGGGGFGRFNQGQGPRNGNRGGGNRNFQRRSRPY